MDQRLDHAVLGERFQMATRFTELDALTAHLADPEPFIDQVVERDPLGCQVSPVLPGPEFDIEVPCHRGEGFRFDEGEVLPASGRAGLGRRLAEVAILAQSATGNGVDGASSFDGLTGRWRHVDRFHRPRGHQSPLTRPGP